MVIFPIESAQRYVHTGADIDRRLAENFSHPVGDSTASIFRYKDDVRVQCTDDMSPTSELVISCRSL